MTSRLVRRLGQGAGLSGVKLLAGLVRIKALAILLGPEGVGVFSLMFQIEVTVFWLVSLCLINGMISLGRPHVMAGRMDEVGALIGTGLAMVTASSLVFVAIFVGAYDQIARGIGSGAGTAFPVWPIAVAVVAMSFTNVTCDWLAVACDRYDLYARTHALTAVFDVVLVVGGAYFFGLAGAVVALAGTTLVQMGLAFWFVGRHAAGLGLLTRLSLRWRLMPKLAGFSVAILVATLSVALAQVAGRMLVTASSGPAANGLLQVAVALGAFIQPFIVQGLWGHLFPIAAAEGVTEATRNELRRSLVIAMRGAAALCLCAVIAAPILIPLFYTSAFAASERYMAVFLAAEIAFIFCQVALGFLLAVQARRAYVVLHLIYAATLLIAIYGASALFGLSGGWPYVTGHAFAASALLIATVAHFLRAGLIDRATLVAGGFWFGLALATLVAREGLLRAGRPEWVADLGAALLVVCLGWPLVGVALGLLRRALGRT